jgi:hypothetical protein
MLRHSGYEKIARKQEPIIIALLVHGSQPRYCLIQSPCMFSSGMSIFLSLQRYSAFIQHWNLQRQSPFPPPFPTKTRWKDGLTLSTLHSEGLTSLRISSRTNQHQDWNQDFVTPKLKQLINTKLPHSNSPCICPPMHPPTYQENTPHILRTNLDIMSSPASLPLPCSRIKHLQRGINNPSPSSLPTSGMQTSSFYPFHLSVHSRITCNEEMKHSSDSPPNPFMGDICQYGCCLRVCDE